MNEQVDRLFRWAGAVIWMAALAGIFITADGFTQAERGDFLIRATVRLSIAFWAVAAALLIGNWAAMSTVRLVWTLAAVAYLIHVGEAFEHFHGWSHAAAVKHVEQTSGFGPGIFVSYLFTLLWLADTLWWWLAPQSRQDQPRWLGQAWHAFMVFIIFNGTVVYEEGGIRYAAVGMFALLLVLLVRQRLPARPVD